MAISRRRRTIITAVVAAVFLAAAVTAFGQSANRHRHPNLAAAQVSIEHAIHRLSLAQAANHGRLGGHAERAKRLLDEAYHQIGLAARVANRAGR